MVAQVMPPLTLATIEHQILNVHLRTLSKPALYEPRITNEWMSYCLSLFPPLIRTRPGTL